MREKIYDEDDLAYAVYRVKEDIRQIHHFRVEHLRFRIERLQYAGDRLERVIRQGLFAPHGSILHIPPDRDKALEIWKEFR